MLKNIAKHNTQYEIKIGLFKCFTKLSKISAVVELSFVNVDGNLEYMAADVSVTHAENIYDD